MKYIKIFEDLIEHPGIRLTPTGKERVESWVNIKVDKDMRIRVSRYTRAIDEFCSVSDISEKFEILSNPKISKYGKQKVGVQGKLAIIILLQYLKEIKNNFDGSASGFLFEEYVSGLLHLKRVPGNKNADIKNDDSNQTTYQVKFYEGKSISKIKLNPEPCDFYVVGLKYADYADIWILEHNVHRLKANGQYIGIDESGKTFIDVRSLKNNKEPYRLDFKNIDKNIESISNNLREYIDEVYQNVSELSYNIETILTGVNEDQKVLSPDKIEIYYQKSENCIRNLSKSIKDLKEEVVRSVRNFLSRH